MVDKSPVFPSVVVVVAGVPSLTGVVVVGVLVLGVVNESPVFPSIVVVVVGVPLLTDVVVVGVLVPPTIIGANTTALFCSVFI